MYGQMFRNARISKGIKQKFIAEKLGISVSSYYELEAGRRSATLERAEEIAIILGMTLIDLLRYKVSDSLTKKQKEASPKSQAS